MRRLLLIWCLLLVGIGCISQSEAFWQSRDSNYNLSIGGSPPSYTGPGDVVSGAVAWWGLRAYNAAYAASLGKITNVCNPGDAACADLSSNSSGALVISTIGGEPCSVAITSGTYVSATGAISLVTVSGSNLSSGNIFSLSALTGTGSVAGLDGEYTATTGTTGTTVNATGTSGFGSIAITGGTVSVCTIKTLYDQSGNTNCTTACDITQATIASRPVLALSCIGVLPCMTFGGSTSFASPALGASSAQPYTISGVAALTGNFGSLADVLNTNSGSILFSYLGSNNFVIFAGSFNGVTATTNGSFSAIQGIYNDPSSSVYVDGTSNAITAGPGGLTTSAITLGGPNHPLTGNENEIGIWETTAFNGTQQSAMNSNQHTYWGF